MAAYSKITLSGFKSKLDSGGYGSVTGARRAIGRMTAWTEEDKNKASRMANKHFGAAPANTPAKSAGDASKGKKEAKKRPKKAAKAGDKKTAAAKEAQPKTRAKATNGRSKKVKPEVVAEVRMKALDFTIGSIRQLLVCMQQAKELGDGVDVVSGAQRAQDALEKTVDEVMALTSDLPHTKEEKEKTELFVKVARGNSGTQSAIAVSPQAVPEA